ncbi:unnamed protein product [Heterobilharzia americana]|nr:unnamed protein product [Heterobilharzia americana]
MFIIQYFIDHFLSYTKKNRFSFTHLHDTESFYLYSDDDEIVETTWVVKVGDKNVTDKDLLNFLNNHTDVGELFEKAMKGNGSDATDKDGIETETSWFTAPRSEKLNNEKIMKFLDKDTDLDHMLRTLFPAQKDAKSPIKVLSSRHFGYRITLKKN